jgi:hypothetical protein
VAERTLLTVGVGDIHGRFHRVREWLSALEDALGRPLDLVFAVGDVEAFAHADDVRRKATKRNMPAEFATYVATGQGLGWPLYFIGGNNEDFEALHAMPKGGELAPDVHYLGRVGRTSIKGLRVAFLSGIYAPRFFEAPLEAPLDRDTRKHAGYFRKTERDALLASDQGRVDLLLLHEWPRGLSGRRSPGPGAGTEAPKPWMGNRVATEVVERLSPAWVLCGHSHVPWCGTVDAQKGQSRITCLDQATRPDSALFWTEWSDGVPVRAGWGIDASSGWQTGDSWGPSNVPIPKHT